MTENQIIDGIIRGQEDAFVQLIQLYGNKLLGTCYLILGDRQEAEDVVQETFIKVFKNIKSFNRKSRLYTWIYRIAINLSRDLMRKRTFDLSLDESLVGESGVDEIVEQDMQIEYLKEGMASLGPIYREALVLFYFQDLSILEMAELLQEKEGTVKSRLSRARRLLSEEIRKGGIGYEQE